MDSLLNFRAMYSYKQRKNVRRFPVCFKELCSCVSTYNYTHCYVEVP